jgi:hypothetical protein
VGSDFKDEAAATEVLDFKGIENWRQVISLELNIDDSTNDRFDLADNSL